MIISFIQTVNVDQEAWAEERQIPVEDVEKDVLKYFEGFCQFQVEECMCLGGKPLEVEVIENTPTELEVKTKLAAIRLAETLRSWLTPAEMALVNERNATSEYQNCCASHDFCDANEAMFEAMDQFCQLSDEDHMNIHNGAWDMAKKANFDVAALTKI